MPGLVGEARQSLTPKVGLHKPLRPRRKEDLE